MQTTDQIPKRGRILAILTQVRAQGVNKYIFAFVEQTNQIWNWHMCIQEPHSAIWRQWLLEKSRPLKLPMFRGHQNFISKLINGLTLKHWRSRSPGTFIHRCVEEHAHTCVLHTRPCTPLFPWSLLHPTVTAGTVCSGVARQDSWAVINQPARKNTTSGDAQFCLFPHWMGH